MASKSPWLTECDPISLEPLRLLRYPPFECRADLSLSHCVASDWFDGRVLASYLVSTGNFTHPISRRELTRADCAALDRYLVENCLSITSTSRLFPEGSADGSPSRSRRPSSTEADDPEGRWVQHAYEHRDDYNSPPSAGSRVEQLRAEASSVLRALFAGIKARLLHVISTVTVQLVAYDLLKRALGMGATGL